MRRRTSLAAAIASALAAALLGSVALLFCGCSRSGQPQSERVEWVVMGTRAAFQCRNAADLSKAAAVKETFAAVERLLNAHDSASELSRLATLDDSEVLARCSPLVRDCYAAAFRHRDESGGVFNPRWRGKATLDLGAIAKGFALDLAAGRIGSCDALLDLGGNLKAVDGEWKIGVYGSGDTMILRAGESCSTSGQYFRPRHIKDGRTGEDFTPRETSVTVIHPTSAMEADALSTTLFILGRDAGSDYLRTHSPTSRAIWQ